MLSQHCCHSPCFAHHGTVLGSIGFPFRTLHSSCHSEVTDFGIASILRVMSPHHTVCGTPGALARAHMLAWHLRRGLRKKDFNALQEMKSNRISKMMQKPRLARGRTNLALDFVLGTDLYGFRN